MDFWKAILGLVRRKYVGPPLLGIGILLAAVAFLLTPAHYTSSTTMVLTIPTTGGTISQDPNKPTGLTNPLLNFGDGLKTTSAILIQAMNTPEVAAELGVGGATKLTVNDGSAIPALLGVSGPFVYLEGEGASATDAHDVVVRAQDRVRAELENRQKALGAPPITYIKLVDVVPASTPEVKRGSQFEIAAAALVLTVIGGLSGAYAAQRLLTGRRRRAALAAGTQDAEPQPTDAAAAQSTDAATAQSTDAAADQATVRFAPVAKPNGVPVNGTDLPVPQRTHR